jgi:hypothetical protein
LGLPRRSETGGLFITHHQGAAPPTQDCQMTSVGLFAGRGDVVLSMVLALLFGAWAGWQLRGLWGGLCKAKAPC